MLQTILFDLDGTLTDPEQGITRSIQYALKRLGHTPPEAVDLRWCIGPPLRASFVRLLGADRDADAALALYRERFSETGLFENAIYGGIPEALKGLKREGMRLMLATSKPRVFAQRILDHFDLSQWFDAVHGSELDGTRSDKAELIAWITAQHALDPATALMVGDRRHDVVGALANGMPVLGVLYGFGTRAELIEAGASEFCARPADLAEQVLRLVARP